MDQIEQNFNSLPEESQKRLRALRMWHWTECVNLRKRAHKAESTRDASYSRGNWNHYDTQSRRLHAQANFHLLAVQTLNDVVPGTAEQDCQAS